MESPVEKRRPVIGVGVLIVRDGRVLLGQRMNSHGAGAWSLPGGHLEWNESFEECAVREVQEETGLQITNIRPTTFTNDVFRPEDKHYVTLFLLADWAGGEAEAKEPEKCSAWQWFSWDALPEPLFLPIQHLLVSGFRLPQ